MKTPSFITDIITNQLPDEEQPSWTVRFNDGSEYETRDANAVREAMSVMKNQRRQCHTRGHVSHEDQMNQNAACKVVNIRKSGLINRPKSHWPEDHVYIGRPSKFGNPVAIGKPCPECSNTHMTGELTLSCYETYLQRRIADDAEFRVAVAALAGKVLVCWCAPKPCHGNILAAIAVKLHGSEII